MNIDHCIKCKCCRIDSRSYIPVEENKKIFSIKNPEKRKIFACNVDNCLISSNENKKCDYMFIIDSDSKNRIILVELKGKNYAQAVRQIISTAEELKFNELPVNIKKESFIVGSSHPKIGTTMQSELKKQAYRFKAVGLSVPRPKTNKMEIKI